MYEELVKRLREEASCWCATCCYRAGDCICSASDDRKKDCAVYTKLQAADAIEAMCEMVAIAHGELANIIESYEESKPRWIPVEERLPDEEEVVLVWGGASVYTAKRHNEYGGLMWWKLNSKRHYCNPTHWMPLPKPPKEET